MVKSLSAKFRPNYCVEITVRDGDIVYVSLVNYKVGSEEPVVVADQEKLDSEVDNESSEEQSQVEEREVKEHD